MLINQMKKKSRKKDEEAMEKIKDEIKHLKLKLTQKEIEISKDPKYFLGKAFVSFKTVKGNKKTIKLIN